MVDWYPDTFYVLLAYLVPYMGSVRGPGRDVKLETFLLAYLATYLPISTILLE